MNKIEIAFIIVFVRRSEGKYKTVANPCSGSIYTLSVHRVYTQR